jgi:hypothetical protein
VEAEEKLGPEVIFEVLDVMADGWLSYEELLGCGLETPGAGNGIEGS